MGDDSTKKTLPMKSKASTSNETLKKIIMDALEDIKAQQIKIMHVGKLTSITDVMIVCHGTSSRHIKSIADKVVEKSKHAGFQPLSVQGSQDWVIVDFGDIVLHVMTQESRSFYRLEDLWSHD